MAAALLCVGGCAEQPTRYTPPPLHGDATSYNNYPAPPQHDTIKPSPKTPDQWRALTDSAARSIQKKNATPPPRVKPDGGPAKPGP